MSEDNKKTTEENKDQKIEKKDTPATETKEKVAKDDSKKSTSEDDKEKKSASAKATADEGKNIPELKPGMTVRVYQKIKEMNIKGEEKERVQYFEGMIIAKKHGKEIGATITMRKVSNGIAVEKIFPLNLPTITKIEIKKIAKVNRAKLYFLKRGYKKKLKETKVD
jgi:large subunit ribosomal protein L19